MKDELDLGSLSVEGLEDSGDRRAKYDLTLSMQEVGERIVGELEYASALYERSTMQRHVRYLQALLEGMVADDQQLIERLPLLDETERDQLLVKWNATQREYPQESCIHELFEAQVERTPKAVAVVCEEQSLSYGELNAQANRLARHLKGSGVGPEVRVAICAQRGIEMVVGLLATLKAGGAYVPLDPAYPSERLSYMLQDSGAMVLLHALLADGSAVEAAGCRRYAVVAGGSVCGCGAVGPVLGSEPGSPVQRCELAESGLCDLHLRLDWSAQGGDGRASQRVQSDQLALRGVPVGVRAVASR